MAAYKAKTQESGAYCAHCGDDLDTDTVCTYEEKRYHKKCIEHEIPNCKQAIEDYKKHFQSNHTLLVGIHVSYLYGQVKEDQTYKKNKKKKRDCKIQEFINKVSALRNSSSGRLFIQLVGLAPGDQFIGAFNEFVDYKLYALIQDGSDFSDSYQKLHLGTFEPLQKYTDIIVLYVEAGEYITTSNFKTKIALDDGIIDPHPSNLKGFLRKKKTFDEPTHGLEINGERGFDTLQENRSVQMKSAFLPKEDDESIINSVLNLKLPEYITAFTKLEEGGSYLFGLYEEQIVPEGASYKSKTARAQPVRVKNRETVKGGIKDRVYKSILVCDYEGNEAADTDILEVRFISFQKVENCEPDAQPNKCSEDRYVIHMYVRPVSGVVFYDKDGPVAYKVHGDNAIRITVIEWFKAFLEGVTDSSERQSTMTTCSSKLLRRIAKEDETEFSLKSSDFWRPPLKQIRASVYKIKEYFVRDGVNVVPTKLLPPLRDIQHKLLSALRNAPRLSQSLGMKRKPDRVEGFIFVSDSLAVALDFGVSDRPRSVICDVFIAVPTEALMVLTVVSNDKNSDSPRIYNVSVASGLTNTLRRFMKEPVNTLYGVIAYSDLDDIQNFETELKKMLKHASLSVTAKSLSMNPTKFNMVLVAFWAGIAETKSVSVDLTAVKFLRFLTLEQCIILVENINNKQVHVISLPGSGATTLMLEVARRKSRLGNTMLVCRSMEESESLRSIFPNTVGITDTDSIDLSKFPNVVDETGTVSQAANCLWQFTQATYIGDESSLLSASNTSQKQISLKGPLCDQTNEDTTMEKENGNDDVKSSIRKNMASFEKHNNGDQSTQYFLEEDSNQRTIEVALIEIPKVSGPVLQFDSSVANTDVCRITRSKELVNLPFDVINVSSSRFRSYRGTITSSPIPRPRDFLQRYTSQYLEIYTNLELKKTVDIWQSIMEYGIMEKSHLDCSNSFKEQPRSWGITLGGCCAHFPKLCLHVYDEGITVKCIPSAMPNTPGTQSSTRYGILLNFGRRRVVFLNLDMGSMIHKFDFDARENIYPIFGVGHEPAICAVKMEVLSGRDISMTDRKKQLIQKALAME